MRRPSSVGATPTATLAPIPTASGSASQHDDVTHVTANSQLQQEAGGKSTTIQQDIQGNDNTTVSEVVASGERSIGVGNVGRDVYINVRPKWLTG